MSSVRFLVVAISVLLLGAPFGSAYATPVQYTFTASGGLFSFNRDFLEAVTGLTADPLQTGWVVAGGATGSFTYDNSAPLSSVTGDISSYFATDTMTVNFIVDDVTVDTLSGDDGITIVIDDPGGNDLFNVAMTNTSQTWSGFSVGPYDMIAGGAIWAEGDFLPDGSLPGILPPPPGYTFAFYRFGFVGPDLPAEGDGIIALDMVVTPVLLPTSDVTGIADISGDDVPDIAQLRAGGRPRVRYYSGASRQKIKGMSYLGEAWSGVAIATVTDSDANGVANDPAVAVLGNKASVGKHAVEVRRADNGALINKLSFLGPSWILIDVAVIDDKNGDGVTGDTAIAVLGFNPSRPFDQQIKVQVKRLTNGKELANWYFLNGNWRPLALEAVNRVGRTPLLAVLANKAATGANVVQARKLSNGSVQRDTSFFNANWLARDVSVLTDSDGDGNPNDPAYLVLANHPETGRNKVQARRVSDGKRLKNITMLGTNWEGKRVTGTSDISGNLREEVGVLAEKRTDGTVAIQLKDYEDRTTTATIFP